MNLTSNLNLLDERPSLLIVLSGPSGVGKDTLLQRLTQVCPDMHRSVTCTTRTPRPGERPGIDYNFLSKEDFLRRIESGEFLEYAEVHGNLYGSSLRDVQEMRRDRKDVVLKIDVQGGLAVKQKVPEAVMIFIGPPSLEELERRLRGRYTDSEAAIEKRCRDARSEIEQIPRYDYLVINDDVGAAVQKLCCIITAERARIHLR